MHGWLTFHLTHESIILQPWVIHNYMIHWYYTIHCWHISHSYYYHSHTRAHMSNSYSTQVVNITSSLYSHRSLPLYASHSYYTMSHLYYSIWDIHITYRSYTYSTHIQWIHPSRHTILIKCIDIDHVVTRLSQYNVPAGMSKSHCSFESLISSVAMVCACQDELLTLFLWVVSINHMIMGSNIDLGWPC